MGGVGDFDGGHALELSRLLGGGAAVAAGDEDVDVATDLGGCGNGVEGGGLEAGVVVFGDYEDSHDQITFASFFSFSTSSATDLTLIPALRAAGASTFRVFTVEAVVTPNASGVTVSSGFFLAFMMLGSEA